MIEEQENEDDTETDKEPGPTALNVLRAMAQQRVGPPKIINCGVL